MIEIKLIRLIPEMDQLWGATAGQHAWKAAREALEGQSRTDTVVVYDFTGIKATNASFLKAAILPAFDQTGQNSDAVVVPLLKGAKGDVEDEINEIFKARKLPVLLLASGKMAKASILGSIEPFLLDSLNTLSQSGPSSAPELANVCGGEIGATGWNNRLSELHRLRLVRREKKGRSWVYSAIVKEVV